MNKITASMILDKIAENTPQINLIIFYLVSKTIIISVNGQSVQESTK